MIRCYDVVNELSSAAVELNLLLGHAPLTERSGRLFTDGLLVIDSQQPGHGGRSAGSRLSSRET